MAASTKESLQDQLDRITQNTRALVQPERLAVSEKATEDLFNTGIEDRILKAGAEAPAFTLEDALTHKPVRSADLLALGPLVVNFFRGRWCPYCITELEAWRDLHPASADAARSSSPSPPRPPARTTSPSSNTASLPSPLRPRRRRRRKIRHRLHRPAGSTAATYQSILINIPFNNAGLSYHNATEASWRLPLPAIFVIDRDQHHHLRRSPRRLPRPPRTRRHPRRTRPAKLKPS